jgi:hypothetical protein
MKSVIIVITVVGIINIFAGTCMGEGLQNGFGGIEWSASLEQVKDCEMVGVQDGIQYYLRPNQPHTLLGESVPHVLYGFYLDAFFAVFIRIENDEVYARTRGRLMDLLGTPDASLDKEGVISTFRWTDADVRIELFNDRSKQGFRLEFYYLPIANKALRQQKKLVPPRWPKIKLFPAEKGDEPEAIGILKF